MDNLQLAEKAPDPYRKLAAKQYGISESEVTPEQRHRIKCDVLFRTYGGRYDVREVEIVGVGTSEI